MALASFLNRRRSAPAPALLRHFSNSSCSRFPPNPISSHSPNPISTGSNSSTTFPPNPISTGSSSSTTFPPNPISSHSPNPIEEDQISGGNPIEEDPISGGNTGGTHWLTPFLLPRWLFPRPTEIENSGDRWAPAPGLVGNTVVTVDFTQFGLAMRENVSEILTMITLFLSFIVGWLSTAFPGEKKKTAKFRCIGVIVFSIILFAVNVFKMNLDRARDNAGCLSYIDKRQGNDVVYWKGLSHILSCTVIVSSLAVGVIQLDYVTGMDSADYDPNFVYWMGILGMFLAFANRATQTFQVIRRPRLGEKREGTVDTLAVLPLRMIPGVPPRGREDFYEVDPDKQATEMPV